MNSSDSWKPVGVTEVRGEYINKYPNRVEDRSWWLLGTRESDEGIYLDAERDQIILVERTDDEELIRRDVRPLSEFNTVWEDVRSAASGDFGWDTWSQYSWAAKKTGDLVGRSRAVVADEQLAAYVYRDIYSISRKETAEFLGKSPHTIDNQLAGARKKIEHAQRFLEGLHRDSEAPLSLDV